MIELGTSSFQSLCKALQSPQWSIRSYAASILGKIQNKQAVDPLIDALPHSDSTFRKEIIEALGILGDPRAIPVLLRTLALNEPETIQPLIEALSKLNDPRTVPAMIQTLKVEEWARHEYIIDRIISMGPQIIEYATPFVDDSNPLIRIGVAKILGWFHQPTTTELLIQLTSDPDQEVRRSAAESLSQHQNGASMRALVSLLADSSKNVSSQAAKAIIKLAPHSRKPLIQGLCHQNPLVRGRSAMLLCEKDVHKGATTPFELAHRAIPYLMDTLLQQRGSIKFVAFLLKHIKSSDLARRIGLVYQGYPHLSHILEELQELNRWEHLSLIAHDFETLTSRYDQRKIKTIHRTLKEASKAQRKIIKDGYCLQHHARFSLQNISGFEFMGCRKCASTIFGIRTPSVHLYLDRTMQKDVEIYPNRIHVNRLSLHQAIDFDHVHIGLCDQEEVRSLCIEIGNDTDPHRKKAYNTATCTITSSAMVDDELVNLLTQHFRTVSYAR